METAQDYVEAIADLSRVHGEARAVDLARRLGVSHVTVIRAVSRLQRDGFVSSRPYRSIFLTEKGTRLYQAVCELDLEGIVAKRMSDPYAKGTRWFEILNRDYSQKVGRSELFERG